MSRRLTLTLTALFSGLAAAMSQPPPAAGQPARQPSYFQANCAACHGANASGGPGGAANLLQSPYATATDGGAGLRAFLAIGRPDKGMPAFNVSLAEAAAISSELTALRPVGAPPRAGGPDPVLVGDAGAGKRFFNGPIGKCSTCHAVEAQTASSASNLSTVASRYPDARRLQNAMLLNRGLAWSPARSKDVTAKIVYRDGRSLSGFLTSVSDFKVIIRDEQGKETEVARHGGEPKVILTDRLQHHIDLLSVYNDSDIHNLTSYLATLK